MLLMEYILRQDSKNIGECHPAFFTNSLRKGAVLENLGGQTGQHLTVFLSLVLVKHTQSDYICRDGKVFCQKVQKVVQLDYTKYKLEYKSAIMKMGHW